MSWMEEPLYTETRIRINPETNEFFDRYMDALAFSKEKRSYPYQVFNLDGKHTGYAVPK